MQVEAAQSWWITSNNEDDEIPLRLAFDHIADFKVEAKKVLAGLARAYCLASSNAKWSLVAMGRGSLALPPVSTPALVELGGARLGFGFLLHNVSLLMGWAGLLLMRAALLNLAAARWGLNSILNLAALQTRLLLHRVSPLGWWSRLKWVDALCATSIDSPLQEQPLYQFKWPCNSSVLLSPGSL
jgi:hypothetical protein